MLLSTNLGCERRDGEDGQLGRGVGCQLIASHSIPDPKRKGMLASRRWLHLRMLLASLVRAGQWWSRQLKWFDRLMSRGTSVCCLDEVQLSRQLFFSAKLELF